MTNQEPNVAAQEVAELLHRSADLMHQATRRIREYAERAAAGTVAPANGSGYHFLVDQTLCEYVALGTHLPLGRAFQAAADADRDQERTAL